MPDKKNFDKNLSDFFNNLNHDINQKIDLGVGGVISEAESAVEEIGEKIEGFFGQLKCLTLNQNGDFHGRPPIKFIAQISSKL